MVAVLPGQAPPRRHAPAHSSASAAPRVGAHPQEEPCNSEDEYDSQISSGPEQERAFVERLAARGLQIREMKKDGNCLFRCISDRVYGDAEMHDVARQLCMDHMEKERDHFSQYVTQDFEAYLRRKRRDGTFGNHIEMQALSEIYSRPIEVYAQSDQPINTFQSHAPEPLQPPQRQSEPPQSPQPQSAANASSPPLPPLRLSYHGRNHYNVIFDPAQPDVGVGLGLPGLQPGLADKSQLDAAKLESEQAAIERDLLTAAQDSSELDATQEAIEEAVMRASRDEYLQQSNVLMGAGAGAGGASTLGWEFGGAGDGGGSFAAEGDSAAKRSKASQLHQPSGTASWEGSASGGGSRDATGWEEPPQPEANETVKTLLAMGFPLARALYAHEVFGDNLENCLEVLTND